MSSVPYKTLYWSLYYELGFTWLGRIFGKPTDREWIVPTHRGMKLPPPKPGFRQIIQYHG